MLEGVFPIGDIYFFSSSVQRFWLLRYLTNYDCNKGHKGLICWPLVPAEIIWDMLTTVYLNTRLTSWLMWPNRTRKTWTEKNTTESSNASRFTFWQIYNWLWNMLFKKFIAPEQINMSFTFTYIKCQAKQIKHMPLLNSNYMAWIDDQTN